MELFTSLRELLHSGDPTVRSWFLIQSFWTPFLLSALYVFFVTRLGPYLMRNRKPFDLRHSMIVYNFCIVAIYVYTLYTIFYYFLSEECNYKKLCSFSSIDERICTYEIAFAGWIVYLIKYIEFSDTIFFVLRKKFNSITYLHVVHHAILPLLGWFLFRTEKSAFQFLPALINSVVHVIMYTYYGLAAMGPNIQKMLWWKKYLTLLQMGQFVAIMILALVMWPLTGCMSSSHGLNLVVIIAAFFLLMFYNFYKKTYDKKPLADPQRCKTNAMDPDDCASEGTKNGRNPINCKDSWLRNLNAGLGLLDGRFGRI